MDRITAENILEEARIINNGIWKKHSCNVARLAEKKAQVTGFGTWSTGKYKEKSEGDISDE